MSETTPITTESVRATIAGIVHPILIFSQGVQAHWDKAFSMPDPVDDYWREAKRITDIPQHNPTVKKGGMDFSDTVEALWIFDLRDEVKRASDDVLGFFREFD